MAASTPASVGRVNAAGSEDALFLKVFSGEVLTSFEQASVTAGAEMVRSISSGKSATFPVMGRIVAAYHTPGAELTGSDINHNEKVVTINDLLVSSVFLSNLEEAKNHWDVRSAYSQEIGRALAFQKDKHVLQTMGLASQASANVGDSGYGAGSTVTDANIASATDATAAQAMIDALFDAAKNLDDNYVPKEGRKCFIRPEEYYKMANATNAVNIDYSGQGSIAEGKIMKVAGIEIISTPHDVFKDAPAGVARGSSESVSEPQAVNLANYVALVVHPSAVGTVKLLDLSTEMEYDIRRQGTLMVAKYAMGHASLRPEAAVGIKEA